MGITHSAWLALRSHPRCRPRARPAARPPARPLREGCWARQPAALEGRGRSWPQRPPAPLRPGRSCKQFGNVWMRVCRGAVSVPERNDLSKTYRNDVDVANMSAPQFCRSRRVSGAKIDTLATSFRHLFDKSFLTRSLQSHLSSALGCKPVSEGSPGENGT